MPPKIRRNRLFFILTNISKKPNLVTLLKSCKLYAIPIIIIGGAKLFESVYKILPPHVADVVFFRDSHVGTFVNMDFYVYAPNAAPPGSALEGDNVVKLENIHEFLSTLNNNDSVKVLGIEIPSSTTKRITSLDNHPPISSSTALMLGNEGAGMSPKQISICDEFVYVKQYSGDTASFNVAVAFGIVADRLSSTLV